MSSKLKHQPPIRVKSLELMWSEPSQTADGSGVAVRASEVTTRCQNPRHAAGLLEEYDCYMSLRCRAHSLIARRWREVLKIPCIQEKVAAGLLVFRGLLRACHIPEHIPEALTSGEQLTDIESSRQELNKQIFTFILIKKQNGDTFTLYVDCFETTSQ